MNNPFRGFAAVMLFVVAFGGTAALAAPSPALSAMTFSSARTGTVVLNSLGWSGKPGDPAHPVTALSMQLKSASQGAVFSKLAATHTVIKRARITDGLAKSNWRLTDVTVTSVQAASSTGGGAAMPIVLMSIGSLTSTSPAATTH